MNLEFIHPFMREVAELVSMLKKRGMDSELENVVTGVEFLAQKLKEDVVPILSYNHLGRPGDVLKSPEYVLKFKEKVWGLNTAGPLELYLGLQLDYGFKPSDFSTFVEGNKDEVIRLFRREGELLLQVTLAGLADIVRGRVSS